MPLKISGANIPAVPLPHATTALIFFCILFFEIKFFLYTSIKFSIFFILPLPDINFLFNTISFSSCISSGAWVKPFAIPILTPVHPFSL